MPPAANATSPDRLRGVRLSILPKPPLATLARLMHPVPGRPSDARRAVVSGGGGRPPRRDIPILENCAAAPPPHPPPESINSGAGVDRTHRRRPHRCTKRAHGPYFIDVHRVYFHSSLGVQRRRMHISLLVHVLIVYVEITDIGSGRIPILLLLRVQIVHVDHFNESQ